MQEDEDYYGDEIEGDDPNERIEELEARIVELENAFRKLSSPLAVGGYGLGAAIAVVVSWSRNASILWCIFHGCMSWIYVIYFAATR